jgi:hypothetical protein
VTTTTTKEHPILFAGEMVRALLDGRKTQTRRVVKPEPPDEWEPGYYGMLQPTDEFGEPAEPDPKRDRWGVCDVYAEWGAWCPYGVPGDRLWVREAFFDTAPYAHAPLFMGRSERFAYRADQEFIGCHRWKPSIHMPRRTSRITLEVKAVRVERVQAITFEDALAEGVAEAAPVQYGDGYQRDTIERFQTLWDTINKARGYGWDANPWVWVVEFERVEASA